MISDVVVAAVVVVGFAASTLAAIFTNSQWADVQSALNFILLVWIAKRQEKGVPQKTAEATAEAVTDDGGYRDELIHMVIEAMEQRASEFRAGSQGDRER